MLDLRRSPRRVGTPFVESLTSVARRLAELDHRTIAVLLDVYVTRALGAAGRDVRRFIAGSLSEAVNGSSALTTRIVEGLGSAFAIPDLAMTTLLSTNGQIHSERDFRAWRTWCPRCLAEDGYDQLLWAFRGVTVCVRHRIQLVHAPRCGHRHRPWAAGATPTRCPVCGCDLADVDGTPAEVDGRTAAYAQVLAWLQSGRRIGRAELAAGIRHVITSGATTPTELTRRTGLSISTIGFLRSGAAVPQISSLVSLLAGTTYRLEDLLDRGAVVTVQRRRSARPRMARTDLRELERVLRAEALRPRDARRTLTEICGQFGRGHAYASRHLPELTAVWNAPGHRRRGRGRAA